MNDYNGISINISYENTDDITIGESNEEYPRGDVNQDGKVTSADLLYLKKYLLSLIER